MQDTATRASLISGGSGAIVVCNEKSRFLVAEQLAAFGTPAPQLLKPVGHNTAAAIPTVASEAENPVLLVLSSDHAIADLAAICRCKYTITAPNTGS